MTFTTAAASEMRDRIGAVAGKAVAKSLMINTFHSFSLQLCRLHAEKYVNLSFIVIHSSLFHLVSFIIACFSLQVKSYKGVFVIWSGTTKESGH